MLVDDLLLVQAKEGDVVMVAADPAGYREYDRIAALNGKTWNHPTMAGKRLLVRNDHQAACYGLPQATD